MQHLNSESALRAYYLAGQFYSQLAELQADMLHDCKQNGFYSMGEIFAEGAGNCHGFMHICLENSAPNYMHLAGHIAEIIDIWQNEGIYPLGITHRVINTVLEGGKAELAIFDLQGVRILSMQYAIKSAEQQQAAAQAIYAVAPKALFI